MLMTIEQTQLFYDKAAKIAKTLVDAGRTPEDAEIMALSAVGLKSDIEVAAKDTSSIADAAAADANDAINDQVNDLIKRIRGGQVQARGALLNLVGLKKANAIAREQLGLDDIRDFKHKVAVPLTAEAAAAAIAAQMNPWSAEHWSKEGQRREINKRGLVGANKYALEVGSHVGASFPPKAASAA
jgi:hypothetical protein